MKPAPYPSEQPPSFLVAAWPLHRGASSDRTWEAPEMVHRPWGRQPGGQTRGLGRGGAGGGIGQRPVCGTGWPLHQMLGGHCVSMGHPKSAATLMHLLEKLHRWPCGRANGVGARREEEEGFVLTDGQTARHPTPVHP